MVQETAAALLTKQITRARISARSDRKRGTTCMDRNTPLYDTNLSDRERAEYLVSQMTIEEKCDCFSLWLRNDRLGIPL